MGAQEFTQAGHGATVDAAFYGGRLDAQFEDDGTGNLAKKDTFVVITGRVFPDEASAEAYAERLLRDNDPRISDKWGPAGAVRFASDPASPETERWMFFGIASN